MIFKMKSPNGTEILTFVLKAGKQFWPTMSASARAESDGE